MQEILKKKVIDVEFLKNRIKEWAENIDDTHKAPDVESETLEMLLELINENTKEESVVSYKPFDLRWEADTAPIHLENINASIEKFINEVQETPWLFFKYLRIGDKYVRIVDKTVCAIEDTLQISLKEWQIDYIFYDMPIPKEVEFSRTTGKTIANILKLCFSQGPAITVGFDCKNKTDLMRLGAFAGEDCATYTRANLFMKQLMVTYNILKKQKEFIFLREINFK